MKIHRATEVVDNLNNREQTVAFLVQEVSTLTGDPAANFSEATRLIGRDAVLNSLNLVELLLDLEEFCEDTLHVHFDWASDSAMSEYRSIFRTIGSVADHVAGLSVF